MELKLSNTRVVIVISILVITFAIIQFSGSVKPIPIKKHLNEFPHEIGGWTFIGNKLFEDRVMEKLNPDEYILYTYRNSQGQTASLYVSYFGAVGVTGEPHTPRNCLPGGGWNVIRSQVIPVEAVGQKPGQGGMQKVTIENGPYRQDVIYWYANRGRMIASEYWEKIYLLTDAIFMLRRDGSFIRIMGYIDNNNPEKSTENLIEFAQAVSVILEDFIPGRT